MKFFDSLKIALHNLWQNKSRTVLTIIIVLVVSALIMAMVLIGTNFMDNNERMLKQMLDTEGASYNLDSVWHDSRPTEALPEAEIVLEAARNHPGGVDYSGVKFSDSSNIDGGKGLEIRLDERQYMNNLVCADFALGMGGSRVAEVLEGRAWSAADNESRGLWVSEELVRSFAESGGSLTVGDTVPLTFRQTVTKISYDGRWSTEILRTDTVDYTVLGVFDIPETERYVYPNPAQAYISVWPVLETYGSELAIGYIDVGFFRDPADYNYRDAQKAMQAFVDEVNGKIPPNVNSRGQETARFRNSFLYESLAMRMAGLLILGILILLAFLILLLSIGSVANTIIISVDKNRKFIGLMKAMGLKNKGVKQIVYKEAIVTVIIGVALATALIFCLTGAMHSLIGAVLGSMYGGDFTMTFVINPLVPVITTLAFLGMAILFSKGSLNKMGKADVITIISEVA